MLDIKFIRENKDIVAEAARKKHMSFDVDALLEADRERLALLTEVENLRALQNTASDKIASTTDMSLRNIAIEEMRTHLSLNELSSHPLTLAQIDYL